MHSRVQHDITKRKKLFFLTP